MAELTFELHSPMTEEEWDEEWDIMTDVDLDHTPSVMFHTKHGKDVEYVKVKHGRWMKWEGDVLICSNCKHYWIQSGDQYDYRYCPYCGTIMDEVEE